MSKRKILLALLVSITALIFVIGCSSDADSSLASDGDAVDGDASGEGDRDTEPSESDGDLETDAFDADFDADHEANGESERDGDTNTLFDNPHDSLLYAAVGARVITPNESNHPCPHYMGGTGSNRLADGVATDLEARALVLEQNGVHLVLVSLDLVGWFISDVQKVLDALSSQGVEPDHVLISSTHTHTGPDTIGVWGPDFMTSGRCPEYAQFLIETITDLIVQIADEMVPVDLYAAETSINEPGSTNPNLINDIRRPDVANNRVTAARLVKQDGETLSSFVNWHNHVEADINNSKYSADFAHWARKGLEAHFGGTALYFVGTVGGLQTPLGLPVPGRTSAGEPILGENDEIVYISKQGEEKAISLGYVVAEYAIDALESAEKMEGPLIVDTMAIELPFENIIFTAAMDMGVIPQYDGLIKNKPETCGDWGCLPHTLHHIRFGTMHVVSTPGELFPESEIGRSASSHDFGEDWGVFDFEAMTGYMSQLPEGHMLMTFGLTNNEIGYIVPEADYHPNDHPDYYNEYFSLSKKTEAIVRNAIGDLLGGDAKRQAADQ